MTFDLDNFTIVACSVIFASFVAAWIYVATTIPDKLPRRKKWIDQLPSIISTLGVLGTFLGITKGLIAFNPGELEQSIPELLEGLKTAFFTSLVGMGCSLILSRVVSAKFDKQSKGSEIENAARMIIDSLNANQSALPGLMENSNRHLLSIMLQDATMQVIHQDIRQLKVDMETLKSVVQGLYSVVGDASQSLKTISQSLSSNPDIVQLKDDVEELKGIIQELPSSANELAEEISRLRAVAVTSTASVSAIDNNIEDMCSTLSSVAHKMSEISNGKE